MTNGSRSTARLLLSLAGMAILASGQAGAKTRFPASAGTGEQIRSPDALVYAMVEFAAQPTASEYAAQSRLGGQARGTSAGINQLAVVNAQQATFAQAL